MINVKTQNEMIQVGGQFQEALEMVKAVNGRKYDPSTKTWTVPVSTKEFLSHAAFYSIPCDTSDRHYTSYGNVWASEDWDTQKKVWKQQSVVDVSIDDAIWEAQKAADEALKAIGISNQKAINFMIENCYDEERILANVQFTSDRKKARVFKVLDEFWQISSALRERGEDEKTMIEEREWDE